MRKKKKQKLSAQDKNKSKEKQEFLLGEEVMLNAEACWITKVDDEAVWIDYHDGIRSNSKIGRNTADYANIQRL